LPWSWAAGGMAVPGSYTQGVFSDNFGEAKESPASSCSVLGFHKKKKDFPFPELPFSRCFLLFSTCGLQLL